MTIHKSFKSLKRDGIAILILDLVVLMRSIANLGEVTAKNKTLLICMIDILVVIAIQIWWICDSKNWIKLKKHQKIMWYYIIGEVIIYILILAVMKMEVILGVYVGIYGLSLYKVIGILGLARYKIEQ